VLTDYRLDGYLGNMLKSERAPESPIALVTGASGGLGQALAVELDNLGCRVAIHYNRSDEAAEAVQATLANDSVTVRADIGSWDAVEAMYREIVKRLGAVDIVVNNAAIRKDNLMAMQSPDDWRRVIDTNLMGTFYATRVALPHMLRQRWGRVVNIVSPSGLIATAGQTAYSASKAGVIGLTRTLAAECGRRGVTVNAMSPGFMLTAMTEGLSDKVRDGMLDRLPIPRFTTTGEVAESIRFFLESAYVTGQVVSVDGGISIT
jgi:3-oxoacyl-[acyl-carrier protein] reductase